MRTDTAVFILTHGRAREQKTLKTLEKCGYKGKLYLVIDDEDDQMEEYMSLYKDKVIVFSKREVECDTFTNREEWRSVVYARNAVYDIAESMGLRYIFMCDDDITGFSYRVIRNGSLKGFAVNKMGALLNQIADFMEQTDVSIFGFSQAGSFIGGAGGSKYQKGCQRTCSQAMMVDVKARIPWRGIFGEDLHASLDAGLMGKIVLSTMLVMITSPERMTNKGGLHDLYHSNDKYVTYFYSVMAFPSVVKLYYAKGEIKMRNRADGLAPMILSDRKRLPV